MFFDVQATPELFDPYNELLIVDHAISGGEIYFPEDYGRPAQGMIPDGNFPGLQTSSSDPFSGMPDPDQLPDIDRLLSNLPTPNYRKANSELDR